ncbi:peroxisome biogenesis protein 1 [Selaginella moellendorffii]|uniref:peroxisome biogenesis protein 1 n=1 Tax=Selaginella moellendorffii TaxID=88036 RepID=UPI000D1C8515|nr:peroxisome biogenesis protein 1 [Selaginella moellendorffii]XP_024542943.1 peroxisome biogenesis protein 1 [Selaginella moellendorffii]|eukprot:XP_024542942.1 peroxisome biogenesis protein 1 [Selaginella moellendorffii]
MEVEVRRVASSDVGFVALPMHVIYLLQQGDAHFTSLLVLELKISRPAAGDGAALVPWFVAWSGATSNSIFIEVAESLAQCLGLPDRAKVTVRVRIDLPEAQTVLVEPATEDDSEILELHADYLETHILNEVGVLQEGRRFPVSVPGQGVLVLLAKSITPRSVVRLTRGTELVVSIKKRQHNIKQGPQFGKSIWLRIQDIDESLHQVCNIGGKELAVIPTAAVYINSNTAERVTVANGQWVLVRASQSFPNEETTDEQKKATRSAAVRVIYWSGATDGHAVVSAPLRQYLGVQLHGGLCLQSFHQTNLLQATSVSVTPVMFHSEENQTDGKQLKQVISSETVDDKLTLIRAWIKAQQRTLHNAFGGNDGTSWPATSLIALSEAPANRQKKESIFLLSLQCGGQMDNNMLVLDARILDDEKPVLDLRIERLQYLFTISKEDRDVDMPSFKSVWVKGSADEALQRLTLLLTPTSLQKLRDMEVAVPVGILLYGPAACGKTQLALALARELGENKQIQAHRVILKCAELVGEAESPTKRRLKEAVLGAIQHAPSLVVLDDLDALFSINEEGGVDMSATSLAEYLSDVMDNAQRTASVAFLATASGPKSLPLSLRSSGRFDFSVELEPPGIREREGILEQIIASRGFECPKTITSRVAAKCDGYDANDLEIMVDRALHASSARYLAKKAETETGRNFHLTDSDLNDALQGLVPAALKGVAKAGKTGPILGWDDVGGLQEVCRVIRELLELPVRYPKLFASAPLRLRTGVLLYGPPGCGKTHVVAAAAAACSLRYIPVKGPELLDKYIGASEKAVRDVFARAAAAAPCILFFDEFDAIAPKRGHDNTGVTDRVVNQLLAELDGVSALTGVFTFAATNRPDLIDAALLRPGRLDHLLFCDFPSQAERLDILRVLSRHLSMEDDIDLQYLSRFSEGFSGADLKAVLSDAELEAVHSAIERPREKHNQRPVITMEMLKSALARAIPLQEAERKRFASIYSTFTSGRSSSKDSKGKKATLA